MSTVTKSQAIKKFLTNCARPELAELYHLGMECQVNVRQGCGEVITGDYLGKRWRGFTDGLVTWKPIRIPFKAFDNPEWTDTPMSFPLDVHVDGIGMTGWNWQDRESIWFAYDFDGMVGHSEKHLAKLTDEEMEEVKRKACELDYVEVRKSSSGTGLHLYVYVDRIPTDNHHEHAALARAVLGKMSQDAGHDFKADVDVCGGNMWVWHRKGEKSSEAFKLVKDSRVLEEHEVPKNWRDHVKVVKGGRRRNLPQEINKLGAVDDFDDLISRNTQTPLDEKHRALLDWLKEENAMWWWDNDNHMLVSHTWWLQKAHEHFNYKGLFISDSKGTNKDEQNCFACPMRNGSWVVRRFTPGCREHESWEQDSAGWTRTHLNKEPDLKTAARCFDGVEDTKGRFNFPEAETAQKAMEAVGVRFEIDKRVSQNETQVYTHKDGRVIVAIEAGNKAGMAGLDMRGWHLDKGKFTKLFNAKESGDRNDSKGQLFDDLLRFLVDASGEGSLNAAGWNLYNEAEESWIQLNQAEVTSYFKHMGMKAGEVAETMGAAVAKPWKLVTEPFQSEYPGTRHWNRAGARFRYEPNTSVDVFETPTWDAIFEHLGQGITDAVKKNSWCKTNGITTGADYLRVWCAALFQKPKEPLPYLFFYGSQNCGKSSFHEALALLMTRGTVRADACLDAREKYNAELEGAVLCVIEEVELAKSPKVYNKLKDWVTSPDINIHRKNATPYTTTNATHWVQVANSHTACPVFPGDTRIAVIHVADLKTEIAKEVLMSNLKKEATHFLGHMKTIELPTAKGRLAIPVLETAEKLAVMNQQATPYEQFFANCCEVAPGKATQARDMYDAYCIWLGEPDEIAKSSNQKFYKALPPEHAKARAGWGPGYWVPNLVVKGNDMFLAPIKVHDTGSTDSLNINSRGLLRNEST